MTLILKTLAWLKGLQIAYLLSFLSYKLGKYIHNKFSARILNFIRSDYFSKFLIYEFTFYFVAVISIPLITIVQLSFLVNIYPQLEPIILLYNIYTPDIIKQIVTTIILIQNWQFDLMIDVFVYLFKVGETHAVSSMDLFMSITPLFVTVKGAFKNINNYFSGGWGTLALVDKPSKSTRADIIISTFYYGFTEYFIIFMFILLFILIVICYSFYSSIFYLIKFMLTSGMDHGYLVFTMASPIFVTIRHASTKTPRKTTIQKNMVTLKSLKEELDAMKSKHAAVASHTITNDAKGNQTIKTRWSVNPLALMTIISFILTYGAKLPYVSNIVKMLALWYGRRGWWKLLVRFRSGFLYLNAFIGVMWICDVVGFGPTNILAGLTGLGPAYLDIITNTYKTIHNWIFGLFDTKVVPDVPNNPSWKFWQGGGVSPKMAGIDTTNPLLDHMHRASQESIRPLYKNNVPDITINNYNSSWGSLYNWLWYGGVGLISAGVVFITYKFFTDSAFIQDLLGTGTSTTSTAPGQSQPTIKVTGPEGGPGGASGEGSGGEPIAASGSNFGIFALALGRKIINLPNNVLSALNPFNYITSAREHDLQHANFLERQRNLHVQDRKKFPFQEENPYFPWYKRLRIYLFHESEAEKEYREAMLRTFEALHFGGGGSGASTPGTNTPTTQSSPGPSTPRSPLSPGSGAVTPVLKLRSGEGYFEQVRVKVLKMKMDQLDSLMHQASVKTKNATLPVPSPLEHESIRNSIFDASDKASAEYIKNHGGLSPDETEINQAVAEAVANALHSDGLKGIFKFYTDLLAQSRPGTPHSQGGAGMSGSVAAEAGVNLSEEWSKKKEPQSASKSVTPIFGARTPISPSLLNSGGSFRGYEGGTTPIAGAAIPPVNDGVSSELLIEKLNKLESVKGKLKSLDLVDKFDTLSSEIDKASKEIRRKLIERNVVKNEATLALMQAKAELAAEVARLKEMLAEKGIDPSLTPGENNTAAESSSENVDCAERDVNPSENVDAAKRDVVPVPPSENVTQRPSVRSIKNEYGEEVVEHDLKGKKK